MKANIRSFILVAIFAEITIQSIAQNGFSQTPFVSYLYISSFSGLMNQENIITDIGKPKEVSTIYFLVRRSEQDRKRAKTLGLSSLILLATSPLISKANTDIGLVTFITGCTIAPVAVYFGLRSKKKDC